MARTHKWRGGRKRPYIKKVARNEAAKIVGSLELLQQKGDARLADMDISENKELAVESLAEVISENMRQIIAGKL